MEHHREQVVGKLRTITDKSLEEERDATDAFLEGESKLVEDATSDAIRLTRLAVDHKRESQREEVDREKEHQLGETDTKTSQLVDDILTQEREQVDQALLVEREVQDCARTQEQSHNKLIVESLLGKERQETDGNLRTERTRVDIEVEHTATLLENTKAALVTRDQYLSIVSHDLKNPTAAILISTRVMQRDISKGMVDTGSLLKNLGRIEQSAASMNRMINDLLDVERMAQGKLNLKPAKIDVCTLLQECVALFAPLISSKSFVMTIDTDAEPIFAWVDHDRILQVLSNLIGNSLKFTPDGGTIVLSARQHEATVEVSVTDDGPGIPKEVQPQVFQRFSQLNVADRHGLGLGLYIAKWIVESHKGRIWVTSDPGKGCTLSFTLPLSIAE